MRGAAEETDLSPHECRDFDVFYMYLNVAALGQVTQCGSAWLSWLSGLEHQAQVLVVKSSECEFESQS